MNKITIKKDVLNNTMTIERLFNAPREKVWQAYTESSLLEKWWAPKPWVAVTKTFNFTEGGHWHYYMSGPDGEKVWALIDFLTIHPQESFSAQDSFADENGNKTEEIPSTHWENKFYDEGTGTKIVVTLTFTNEVAMEQIIKMGFEEGFTMALNNLEELLAS